MSHSFSRVGLRLGAAIGALSLAAGGALVVSQGAATAGTTVPTLDHFLCYQARVSGPKAPPNILLQNIIQTTPFSPVFGGSVAHCNPANKSVPVALFKAKKPYAHLQCWKITYQTKPVRVTLGNQFGNAIMSTGLSPVSLCLPTWKDRLGPPGLPATLNQPPGLDHFTCYPLTQIAGAPKFKLPSLVKAADEFSAPRYVPLKLRPANVLCVPTVKKVAGVAYPPQSPNDQSLVCFPTSPTPIWKNVFDQNQFGTSSVYPNTVNEHFCLPTNVQAG